MIVCLIFQGVFLLHFFQNEIAFVFVFGSGDGVCVCEKQQIQVNVPIGRLEDQDQ